MAKAKCYIQLRVRVNPNLFLNPLYVDTNKWLIIG